MIPDTSGSYLENFDIRYFIEISNAIKSNKIAAPHPIAVERALPRPARIVRAVLPILISRLMRPIPVAVSRPAPALILADDLIGRKLHKTFKGYGKELFVVTLQSYDATGKLQSPICGWRDRRIY